MDATQIRDRFINYFVSKGHKPIASSSLIPHNDATLLFANAGMNQFKDYFTGKETPPFCRAVTIQKCVRAGGKHNDLENVGFTARHHTFFEMLGNFSFGDYFKKEAVEFAWEFLTKEIKLEPNRLYITVHTSDDEAYELWNKHIGIPTSRIFRKGDKSNFWEMGDTGPCGPCSEIFFDHGENYSTPNFKPQDGEDLLDDELRYVEIWNLVFMQFEKQKDGKVIKLPKPSVDTGAGLERIATILQGKYWNYDSDLFSPIISALESLSNKKYSDPRHAGSMRVVADHIRSTSMLISDGILPSNEGRGYVLRRIIRRAIRHLRELNAPVGTFAQLSSIVFDLLHKQYPENAAGRDLVSQVVAVEEKKFLETLDQGMKFLDEALRSNVNNNVFCGEAAFKLYDTYGFPLDLTETILREKNISINISDFDSCMQKRKADSKKSWKGDHAIDDKIFFDLKKQYGSTRFLGYQTLEHKAQLLAMVPTGESYALLFNETPFYAESGGQVGDRGQIILNDNIVCEISDTQKVADDLFLHITDTLPKLTINATYVLRVDSDRRHQTASNHSATHLLQAALIRVLGNHVKQSGSSVAPDKLRFDFTHMQAMTKEEVRRTEAIVNDMIKENLPISCSVMSKDVAIAEGATALFGEKYGENVRVVKMGKVSTELCGGTHLSNSGDIRFFSITLETSLSTGIRRIEACTSTAALSRLLRRSELLEQLEQLTKLKEDAVIHRIENLYGELKLKQREIDELKDKIQSINSDSLFNNPTILPSGIVFKAAQAPEGSDLRKLSDKFNDKYNSGILLLYVPLEDKFSILLRASRNSKIDCSSMLGNALKAIGGKGGGKPDMAQGSGDKRHLDTVIRSIENQIQLIG